MSTGIIFIAYGKKYVEEAIFSAKSAKKHNPQYPITLFTDASVSDPVFNKVKIIEKDKIHIRCKVDIIYQSPYEKTLFLDTDTMVNYPFQEMFTILDKFDISLAHDFARKRTLKDKSKAPGGYGFATHPDYQNIPYAFPEYNTGVILFQKNKKTQKFFQNWAKTYHKMEKLTPYDQPSFRITLWNSDLRVHTLPLEYNRRAKDTREKNIKYKKMGIFTEEHLKTRIFHFHGLNKMKAKEIEEKAQII